MQKVTPISMLEEPTIRPEAGMEMSAIVKMAREAKQQDEDEKETSQLFVPEKADKKPSEAFERAKKHVLETTRPYKYGELVKLALDIAMPVVCIIFVIAAATQEEDTVLEGMQPGPYYVLSSDSKSCNGSETVYSDSQQCFTAGSGLDQGSLVSIFINETKTLCQLPELVQTHFENSVATGTRSLSLGWKTLLSLIPFVLVFQGILSLKLSSRYVAPFTLIITAFLGLSFFRDADYFKGDTTPTAAGKIFLIIIDRFFWTVFEYAFNVFAAFYFLRVLQLWGIVERMRYEFEAIAPTPNRKILLVGFTFAITLAVVAPAGSNFVIAGSILISMNLLELDASRTAELKECNLRIASLALFGNALTSAYNLLGVMVTTLAEDIGPLEEGSTRSDTDQVVYGSKQFGKFFGMQFLLFACVAPLVMAWMFDPSPTWREKWNSLKGDIPVVFGTGLVYGVMQMLVSWFIGPQLPCLIAGFMALLFYVLIEKRHVLRCALPSKETLKKRLYVVPFILLVVILVVYGLVEPVENALKGTFSDSAEDVMNPHVLKIENGGVKFTRRFAWLYHSGVVVMVIATLTPYLVEFHEPSKSTLTGPGVESPFGESNAKNKADFRLTAKRLLLQFKALGHLKFSLSKRRRVVLKKAMKEALHDVLPILFSITSFASIAKLMGRFEMTQSIASTIVNALSDATAIYVLFMPVIGMLGSALTGSTTTSNFLFARLQVNTARELGLINSVTGRNSIWEVAGIQVLGATAGEIISPMNAVVISLMHGVKCKESELIGRLLKLAILWLLGTMLISLIFIQPTGGFN